MYEFTFFGVQDGNDPPFAFTGTTSDFLEVCCQITKCFDDVAAGFFVADLLTAHKDKLDFLRITDWNFEREWQNGPDEPIKRIVLNKTI